MKQKLWYVTEGPYAGLSEPIYAGDVKFYEEWYDAWLASMLDVGDAIFFLTTETTDVWPEWELEKEIDELCEECPDHEACLTGHPCDYVKLINAQREDYPLANLISKTCKEKN